jgi:hypothetical protein
MSSHLYRCGEKKGEGREKVRKSSCFRQYRIPKAFCQFETVLLLLISDKFTPLRLAGG